MQNIIKRIDSERENLGMKKSSLAKKCDIDYHYLCNILSGLQHCSLGLLSRMAEGVNLKLTIKVSRK